MNFSMSPPLKYIYTTCIRIQPTLLLAIPSTGTYVKVNAHENNKWIIMCIGNINQGSS